MLNVQSFASPCIEIWRLRFFWHDRIRFRQEIARYWDHYFISMVNLKKANMDIYLAFIWLFNIDIVIVGNHITGFEVYVIWFVFFVGFTCHFGSNYRCPCLLTTCCCSWTFWLRAGTYVVYFHKVDKEKRCKNKKTVKRLWVRFLARAMNVYATLSVKN